MLSVARVEKSDKGWVVKVDWDVYTETLGPYRWKWMANIVAWWADGNL